jgi:hypothetical protein
VTAVRVAVVVGTTPGGGCGHCGSHAVIRDPNGDYCAACFHWRAYWGPPPPARSWADVASTFNGPKGTG